MITVRKAHRGDALALAQLAERTFREAFSAVNTPEDMELHCRNTYSEAQQAQFNKGMADVSAAMSRLSDALRGSDNAALLKAAAAVKPAFARTFTAFGRYN